jgi:drug/metabolite transporter (DMT)-like permease
VQVYGSVSLLAVSAAYLTNVGLHLVPYTVKIVVKSCRILPVMGLSVALQGKQYALLQYAAALLMVAGVSMFLAGTPENLNHADGLWLGVLLLAVSLTLDALVSNLEERCFFRLATAAPRVEVIAHMSTFCAVYAFGLLALTGVLCSLFGYLMHFSDGALACSRVCSRVSFLGFHVQVPSNVCHMTLLSDESIAAADECNEPS